MVISPHIVALLLAGAQPEAADRPGSTPAGSVDAASVLGIFESVCLSGGKAPAGFEAAVWTDFPKALVLMNTYGHGGTFFRRASPATYIARTQGAGHMTRGIETRCGVAAQGLDTAAMIERLKKRAQAEKSSEVGASTGNPTTVILGKGGAFTITRADENWVIVRSMGFLIPADSVSRRHRKRK